MNYLINSTERRYRLVLSRLFPKGKRIRRSVIYLLLFGFFFSLWANYSVSSFSDPYISNNLNDLPQQKVGLLLGTSKLVKNGRKNAYFYNRIDATVRLYKAGKIKYVLISGDNGRKEYNEPEDMMEELVKQGIPADHIFLDYAGFRTLDSVLRSRDIFGQKGYIVISQEFHNQRAVFLARKYGITAYGYNAKDVSKNFGFRTRVREYFARTKVYIDLFFGTRPKYGGAAITIPD